MIPEYSLSVIEATFIGASPQGGCVSHDLMFSKNGTLAKDLKPQNGTKCPRDPLAQLDYNDPINIC